MTQENSIPGRAAFSWSLLAPLSRLKKTESLAVKSGAFFMPMTELKVVYRKVEDLIPYARNARTHSDAQVAEIAASIKEYGWTNPILTDGENGIIAGHGRLMAARKLGMDEVPTIDIIGLTDTQKRALILADNKMALNASWDFESLKLEIEDISMGGGESHLITGFSQSELDSILGNVNEDELPTASIDEKCSVIVDFEQAESAEDFFNEMTDRGLKCRLST